MADEDGVQKASAAFYAALNQMLNGDATAMADIWSHSPHVSAMHPVGGRDVGWSDVETTWRNVASICANGQVELVDQLIQVAGDAAYELGVERGGCSLGGQQVDIEHRVTNVYRRESGAWKIVHHHTDVSPAMLDALARLQT